MVTQHDVLDQHTELRRKPGNSGKFFFDHDDAEGDVPDQLPFQGVVKGGAPAQFLQLADVVENGAGQEQVAVDFGIVARRI